MTPVMYIYIIGIHDLWCLLFIPGELTTPAMLVLTSLAALVTAALYAAFLWLYPSEPTEWDIPNIPD